MPLLLRGSSLPNRKSADAVGRRSGGLHLRQCGDAKERNCGGPEPRFATVEVLYSYSFPAISPPGPPACVAQQAESRCPEPAGCCQAWAPLVARRYDGCAEGDLLPGRWRGHSLASMRRFRSVARQAPAPCWARERPAPDRRAGRLQGRRLL